MNDVRTRMRKIFGIKRLDLFVLRQFGLLFVGTFFICQFVLMMQFLWRFIDELIGKGLSMDVLAQFFWYMGLMLVPQALPLAILLSSLITFGNLGESSELTALKAAGISLMQTFRSVIVVSVVISLVSFYFQNSIGPEANKRMAQLTRSMQQKSPELEIPEGVFYDGIPGSNIYVTQKDMATGALYGIMIYRMTGSYEDQAIILADSGTLRTTADKKHLLLTLHSGEWFENMRSQEVSGTASVPYRRETFIHKDILLDYDADFNLTDAASLGNNARAKSIAQINGYIDSLNTRYDSIGREFYADEQKALRSVAASKTLVGKKAKASAASATSAIEGTTCLDSAYARMSAEARRTAVNAALRKVKSRTNDLEFRSMLTTDGDKLIRQHKIETISKFTLALSCLIFLFIGAPLGAIIRKGGLGMPVLVSVLVFIVYYILDNSGYRMARGGMWTIWFGKSLAPGVLIPVAVFFTYKANKDSMVFNVDLWRDVLMRALGMRLKRHIAMKEVIIDDPDYAADARRLLCIERDVSAYAQGHRLWKAPNWVKVFFRYEPDHEIERIDEELEQVIADLSNTRDRVIIKELNAYPVLSTKAHTRPFEHRRLNILAAVVVPVGAFLYLRMWRFRVRLWRDLRVVSSVNERLTGRISDKHLNKG